MATEILLDIPYDQDLMARVRRVPGARWDKGRRLWHVLDCIQVQQAIEAEGLRGHIVSALVETTDSNAAFAKTDEPRGEPWTRASRPSLTSRKPSYISAAPVPAQLSPEQQEAVQRMTETLIRRQYAYSTRKTYVGVFSRFLEAMGPANPSDITKADIERHLLGRVRDDRISEAAQNTIINAIKFYYERSSVASGLTTT